MSLSGLLPLLYDRREYATLARRVAAGESASAEAPLDAARPYLLSALHDQVTAPQGRPMIVVAPRSDRARHGNLCPIACSRNGLVGPLSPSFDPQRPREERLAGLRQILQYKNQVGVDGSEHNDHAACSTIEVAPALSTGPRAAIWPHSWRGKPRATRHLRNGYPLIAADPRVSDRKRLGSRWLIVQ